MGKTAIILAGGKSSRFGRDKTILMWKNGLVIEHIAKECRKFADEIIIVSNNNNKFGIKNSREITDLYKEKGPLGGLHAGLVEAANEDVFVTACDMPYFDRELAEKMFERLTGKTEAVIPVYEGYYQPLFSVFKRTPALITAGQLLNDNKRKVLLLFEKLETFYMEMENENIFFNINYPADYHKLIAGEEGIQVYE